MSASPRVWTPDVPSRTGAHLHRRNQDCRHTNRFQVVSFVGVFIQEEMISGSVFWNAARQVTCFRRVGVDQLDRLLLHVQPLESNMAEGLLEPLKEGGVAVSPSPAVCSWCACERAAAGPSWRPPAGGRQGPAASGACCPRWSLSSPAGGSKAAPNYDRPPEGIKSAVKAPAQLSDSKMNERFLSFAHTSSSSIFPPLFSSQKQTPAQPTCLTLPWKSKNNHSYISNAGCGVAESGRLWQRSPLWFWSSGVPARLTWAERDPSRTTHDAGSPAGRCPPNVASTTRGPS